MNYPHQHCAVWSNQQNSRIIPLKMEPQALQLADLRGQLIRQEETIIFALIERAQFGCNPAVYSTDKGIGMMYVRTRAIVQGRIHTFCKPYPTRSIDTPSSRALSHSLGGKRSVSPPAPNAYSYPCLPTHPPLPDCTLPAQKCMGAQESTVGV